MKIMWVYFLNFLIKIMKQIKSVDYVYNTQGEVIHATVIYFDGTSENIVAKGRLLEVQNQLKFQQKQFLVE